LGINSKSEFFSKLHAEILQFLICQLSTRQVSSLAKELQLSILSHPEIKNKQDNLES